MEAKTLRFFLGANSTQGFVSRFDQLADPTDDWRCYVIKGGPGTGKSSLMKKAAAQLKNSCAVVEEIHCSSDVDSLDGVIFPEQKLSIADGTPPHTIEPKFPGACENVVSLCDCWDKDFLFEKRREIVSLSQRISLCHKTAAGYLYAAGSLLADLRRAVSDAVDEEKVLRFAQSLAQREFPRGSSRPGREAVRFLSAVTNKGPVLFNDTIEALAPRLYILDDSWGVASQLLLAQLRKLALEQGHNIISCYCPLFPLTRIDHLFLPEAGLGFVTRNKFHPVDVPAFRVIHARRFTDMDKIASRKHRISFLQKAARNMVEEASELIAQAKSLHDQLESFYVKAMNFPRVDAVASQAIRELGACFQCPADQ